MSWRGGGVCLTWFGECALRLWYLFDSPRVCENKDFFFGDDKGELNIPVLRPVFCRFLVCSGGAHVGGGEMLC